MNIRGKKEVINEDCSSCEIAGGALCIAHDTLEKLQLTKDVIHFKKGDFLFQRDQKSIGFFFLKKGIVRCYRSLPNGKEQTFHLKAKGDWVGFRDTIANTAYNHSSVCVDDVEACFIPKELLEEMIQKDPNFQSLIFQQMAKEWRESENHVLSLGTKQVHSKLAELLITLHRSSSSSDFIELKITREVLASIIGTKTETLVRALSDLKARNWISVDKNRILIKDLDSLKHLSELDLEPAT